jgi:cellulose synthase (UDP-forming)
LIPSLHAALVSKFDVALTAALAVLFVASLAFFAAADDVWLFSALLFSQFFRAAQVLAMCHTVWPRVAVRSEPELSWPPVDVFIATAGEDVELVARTIDAACRQDYPAFHVFVLNDGFVLGAPNWQDIEAYARSVGVACFTRQKPGGGKAGNLNHALARTSSPFIAFLDADHVPRPDFLSALMRLMGDPQTAFAQSPQYYRNRNSGFLPSAAWEQQQIFFSAIMNGKNALNSAFMCGTNMVARRAALEQIGGVDESSIAEDFATSLRLHMAGWKSVYTPEILAQGLAPEDIFSYYRQQLRWARGSLGAVWRARPWSASALTLDQKIQYLSSAAYYLSGAFLLLDMLFPLIFFFTGLSSMKNTAAFTLLLSIPFVGGAVRLVRKSSNRSPLLLPVAFSMSCFVIHCYALIAALVNRQRRFAVTAKTRLTGNFLYLAAPHLVYSLFVGVGLAWALHREGADLRVAVNLFWAGINLMIFVPFVAGALPGKFKK